VAYPLDRYHRIEAGLANVDEMSRNRDRNNAASHDRTNAVLMSFTRDYTSGELFDINAGHRLSISSILGRDLYGGDVKYDTYEVDWQTYWTYWRRNIILASRLVGIDSSGRDFQEFSLGNRDNLRGYSSDNSLNGRIIGLANLETRLYLFRNIDYDVWFMLPDLYFKSLQFVVFTDNGLVGNSWTAFADQSHSLRNLHNSVGAGLRLNSLIQQQFALILRLDYAKRTDEKSDGIWYFNLGASF
jgi:outer membrane protein assembly factor BamA